MDHLRDYQVDAYKAINATLQNGCHSALMVMATGLGKTETFLQIARDWPGRVLILAHRRELISQPRERYAKRYGEWPEMEMADWHASTKLLHDRCHVTVGSVQTMCSSKRLARWDPKSFDLAIVDEAHHAPCASYRKVIDHFRSGNPDLRILGATATPNRMDEVSLGQIFEEVPVNLGIDWGIANGWLVPVDQYFVPIDEIDWSRCKAENGDLKERDVDAVMGQEKVLHGMARAIVDANKQTIVFTPRASANSLTGVARRCSEIINRYTNSQEAFWVNASTETYVRDSLLSRFKDRELKFFCNIEIATEGFDAPSTECVAIGRPTKSTSFYCQMIGRGLRPLPGVVDGLATPEERRAAIANSDGPRLLVMDFVGNSGKHKLVSVLDVLGGNYEDSVLEAAKERARKSGRPCKVGELLDYSAKKALEERQRQLHANARKRLVADVSYRLVKVDPFDVMGVSCGREPGWHRGRLPSEKQVDALKRFGVEPEKIAEMSFWQAHRMMDELIRNSKEHRATYKQRRTLLRYGEPADVSFDEARQLIDAIAANGWRPIR